jgi:hypothetical protein
MHNPYYCVLAFIAIGAGERASPYSSYAAPVRRPSHARFACACDGHQAYEW